MQLSPLQGALVAAVTLSIGLVLGRGPQTPSEIRISGDDGGYVRIGKGDGGGVVLEFVGPDGTPTICLSSHTGAGGETDSMLTVSNDMGSVSVSPQVVDVSSLGGDMQSIVSCSGMAIKASQPGEKEEETGAQLVTVIQRTGVFAIIEAGSEAVELSWSDLIP